MSLIQMFVLQNARFSDFTSITNTPYKSARDSMNSLPRCIGCIISSRASLGTFFSLSLIDIVRAEPFISTLLKVLWKALHTLNRQTKSWAALLILAINNSTKLSSERAVVKDI